MHLRYYTFGVTVFPNTLVQSLAIHPLAASEKE